MAHEPCDHGPMCRLCQPVDGTLAAILANVDLGRMEFVGTEPDGEMRFRLTPGGQRRIDELLADHSDGKEPAGSTERRVPTVRECGSAQRVTAPDDDRSEPRAVEGQTVPRNDGPGGGS